MEIQYVSVKEVTKIHWILVEEFAKDENPIYPPGIKSQSLLESAVGRQTTSNKEKMKYPDPISNAATLLYGIICDHPFHNGNKRTALVSMLVHLDKNKLSLIRVRDRDLFNLVINVARHTLIDESTCEKIDSDLEVKFIGDWLRNKVIPLSRGDRPITYRDLQRILSHFHYGLGKPDRNTIPILRTRVEVDRNGNRIEKSVTIGSIGFPGEDREISIGTIKRVRSMCHLTVEEGITSDMFYYQGEVIDTFVNKHRTILHRLANK